MTGQHKTTPKAVRMPDGLEARVKIAAEADGASVNGFIVAAIEEKLQRREGGSTASAAPVKRGSTARKPRAAAVPAAVSVAADPAPATDCQHRVQPGAWCKTCKATKPAKEGKR